MVPDIVLKFEPSTVGHLGSNMYSHLPNAIAELIANAYDADAKIVIVQVGADDLGDFVSVIDDGHGMSLEDLASKYLRIGRNRRNELDTGMSESGQRKVSGKKGIGKLALFGVGHLVEVATSRQGSSSLRKVSLDYEKMLASEGEYRPDVDSSSTDSQQHGTQITIRRLVRSSPIRPDALGRSLARLFDYGDSNFRLFVENKRGEKVEVTKEARLDGISSEFQWNLEEPRTKEIIGDVPWSFITTHQIKGRIVSATSPLDGTNRGVALYASGRLINEPEFFGASESSHAFSYLTGFIDASYLDDIKPDVIATDRRAINWEAEEPFELKSVLAEILQKVAGDWRKSRRYSQKERAEKRSSTDFEGWTSTLRGPESAALESLLDTVTEPESRLSNDAQDKIIDGLRSIAPEYADLHWRHMHESIKDAALPEYRAERYIDAVDEAIKRYISEVHLRLGREISEASALMEQAFSENANGLSVFARYKEITGSRITDSTVRNVQRGQRLLSGGVVAGIRNLLDHQEKRWLLEHGAFTNQDCLDILSTISHLLRRLEGATGLSPTPQR
ncbi:TIGR02391 family protein [Arthrobacter bambusae]|uniref:TIGR02391 family protein n=1 Tax=Arthrobacter bambusae TaxID=1338426 RepID=UPI001F509BF3|nr:TIGR02391 family protein [Arthrobacter bambusae]MCI0143183.1 TIGR02391 family protein [Arthrobacter bambusae]